MSATTVAWRCECGKQMQVAASRAGEQYRCPECHLTGWIPTPEEAPAKPRKAEPPPVGQPKPTPVVDPQGPLKTAADRLWQAADLLTLIGVIVGVGAIIVGGLCLSLPSGPAPGVIAIIAGCFTLFFVSFFGGVTRCISGILSTLLQINERLKQPPDRKGG